MKTQRRFTAISLLAFCPILVSYAPAQEKVDYDMINRIRYEGFHNSKIMEIASGLMDGIGERLTGSPNIKRPNDWTRQNRQDFGLSNAHLEAWGPFGRGWANEFTSVRMLSPDVTPLIAYSKAWTPGTDGAARAKVVRVMIRTPQDLERYKGKLAGKIVFIGDDAEVKLSTEPLAQRYNEKSLADI